MCPSRPAPASAVVDVDSSDVVIEERAEAVVQLSRADGSVKVLSEPTNTR